MERVEGIFLQSPIACQLLPPWSENIVYEQYLILTNKGLIELTMHSNLTPEFCVSLKSVQLNPLFHLLILSRIH